MKTAEKDLLLKRVREFIYSEGFWHYSIPHKSRFKLHILNGKLIIRIYAGEPEPNK